MSMVHCKLPKAGLGNQLFPLMNALVFSRINNLPLIVTGYHQLKIGPYLRRERSKRAYRGYFNFQKTVAGEIIDKWKVAAFAKKYNVIHEPALEKILPEENEKKLYIFEKMTSYQDYFIHLKPHRLLVKELLNEVLAGWIKEQLVTTIKPLIGVHIRMGDFRKLAEGEVFKGGHVRTPENYYIDIILGIRNIAGTDIPVTVFTDGYRHELPALFTLSNIVLAEGNADIVDLLQLSRSKIIVSSSGSTFSYWAGFLSDAAFIKHPDHLHANIRLNDNDNVLFDSFFDTGNSTLVTTIKNIYEESIHQ